ncbi:FAD-binding oxidoreductase [Rhodococcus sp. NPDC127528]|uniref:FAD-binding oxidoreductase n=1 Tax=unclassified Rhodococcus (in: high G+C Gram-positive bacteria) TaxID=192944 RepID=UPI00362AFD77
MDTKTPVRDSAIELLRAELSGVVALPGEPGYELAAPWNLAVPVAPRAVVVAANGDDVAATVRFAGRRGLRVAVQRTGHGAVTVGGDALLVHTGLLDECRVDADARTAWVGAGAIWQDVLDAAAPHGLAPLTGSSATVGVAGFLTGAGIGPLVRTYGLSSDHVRSFDIVTGDGELLHVTPDEHAELFWGLRGGKATLGIVTGVEIELLPLSRIHGGALYFDGADAPAVAHAWLDWCRDLPEHTSTSLAFLQLPPLPQIPPPLAGRLTVAVRFASTADESEADALIGRLRTVATALIDTVGPMPYAALSAIHADPVEPMPTHEFSALTHELSHDAVDALLAVAGPGSGSPQTMVELRLLGGALAREPRQRSAFCHRGAAFALMVAGVPAPPHPEAVVDHARAVGQALGQWATGGTLPNFTATADPERIARCYDEDTRHWLSALANEHDPHGVLNVGQVMRTPV